MFGRVTKLIKNYSTIMKSMMLYLSNKPSWGQRSSELLQMVKQLGKPTNFFTLSATTGPIYDACYVAIGTLTHYVWQKKNLMHDNPIIVGYFLPERAKIFLNTVLKPLFKIKDFWLRYEYNRVKALTSTEYYGTKMYQM